MLLETAVTPHSSLTSIIINQSIRGECCQQNWNHTILISKHISKHISKQPLKKQTFRTILHRSHGPDHGSTLATPPVTTSSFSSFKR